jgi:hypothetical protein
MQGSVSAERAGGKERRRKRGFLIFVLLVLML